MRTLRSAAALLAAATTDDRLLPILRALGFDAPPADLDAATRAALGIPAAWGPARIVPGAGSIRALVATAPAHLAIREAITRLASRLAASSPHILWLVIAADPVLGQLGIATWTSDRRPPRVAALIVDRDRIVDSDAETLCALAAAHAPVDVLTHARWFDILGREAVTRRFYQALERLVRALGHSLPGQASPGDRTELALLCASRLLFLSFLEAKGWLDGDRAFLVRSFDECVAAGGSYHRRVLLPLLYGTLNTPARHRSPAARAFGRIPFLNGGLFARTALERRHRTLLFPDDAIGAVFGELLARYRFTAREDSSGWTEAAIDPEMMGRAFESIMASRERRSSGAYYTPHALVDRVTAAALSHALERADVPGSLIDELIAGRPPTAGPRAHARSCVARLRIVDPACGSGAFLVHALERLASMQAALGDGRDQIEIRRDVLTRSIFGVDRNPFAVWLCELRLWLSMVIDSPNDDPRRVPPLPNLDHHIRVGDALAGDGITPLTGGGDRSSTLLTRDGRHREIDRAATITRLRERYVRATGPRKVSIARALDREERRRALALLDSAIASNADHRRDLIAAARSRDLFGARPRATALDRQALVGLRLEARELRAARREAKDGVLPFSFSTHFADAAAAGGFDVVVGNPPWVRLHRIPATARAALRRRYGVFTSRGWERGATAAGAGSGFAAQIDLAALFVERSVELLHDEGVLSLIVPAKLWRSLAGGTVRRLLAQHATILEVDDLGDSPHAFDAAVYPSVITAARGRRAGRPTSIAAGRANHDGHVRWPIESDHLGLDDDPASPWLIVPADVRAAFDLLTDRGIPLVDSAFGRPHLGVKCGCNAAFLVSARATPNDRGDAEIDVPGQRGVIERELLRPVVRGESVRQWGIDPRAAHDRLVWTHDPAGVPLRALPPLARQWFAPWRRRLAARSDRRGRAAWWSLFRIDAARSDLPRVVWADLGRSPRALVLPAGDPTLPLNSCYIARAPSLDDAHALAALLNSPLAAAWTSVVAEPARGGFRRYLGWTMALFPLPRDWVSARAGLATLGACGAAGVPVGAGLLLDLACHAYGLRADHIAPLLKWADPP